ncbi:MAG: hypothetical protein II917_01740, partial [Synergistaceae bacterium]|nr:hypothetical protein [Synergistaceae bacterium]
MNFRKSIFISAILAASILFAVVISGGCGGSSHHFNGSNDDGSTNNKDQSEYINAVTKKLLAEATVTNLAEFLNDKTKSVNKGDILLYILNDDDGIDNLSENTEHLTRINDALETGAIVAFSNIAAGEIDDIIDELGLDVPTYLTDDATSQDKAEIEDLFAVAARSEGRDPSDDIAVVDYYTFYGTELHTPASMDIHVYSGDQEIPFDPSEYTEGTVETVEYYIASEDKIVSDDPNPFKYDHVEDTVQSFFDWCDELDKIKSVKEVESSSSASASTVYTAAGDASATFPGVTASFNFVQNYAPRRYCITRAGMDFYYNHKDPWHRETSVAFNIVPVHSFTDHADYYVIKVTGG